MNTLEAIEARRSIRQFDPAVAIDDATQRTLLQAALRAPSAYNLQHWAFVVVKDPALRRQLQEAARGQKQIVEASLYVLICADTQAYRTHFDATNEGLPDAVKQARSQLVHTAFADNAQNRRDEAIRSGSLAAENLMLAAKSLGYDSVPMVGFDFEKTANLIRLPEGHIIVMSVAIGKALTPAAPRTGKLPYESLVHTDHF